MLLTINIDGKWTARNLAAVLDCFESLAHFIETGRATRGDEFDISGGVIISIPGSSPSYLTISRLAYSSPGSIDLLGAAKIAEQIRLFLEFLINLFVQRNDRELDRKERTIQIAQKRVEVLEKLADLHPQFTPFVEKEAADTLIEAVFEKRITSVSTKESGS